MKQNIPILLLALGLCAHSLEAQTVKVTYQGRIKASGVLVDTTTSGFPANFAFAIVNQNGTTTYWSHDGSSVNGSQPISTIQRVIKKGLFSIELGDEGIPVHNHPGNIPGMVGLPVSVFTNSPLYLRIWFDDGARGMQQLIPDVLLTTAPFAVHAEALANNAVTTSSIADGAVTFSKLANAAVGPQQIAPGAVGTTHLGGGVVTSAQIASGAITGDKLANNSISSAQIMNGAITSAKLADGAVVTAKIADGAITTAKIANFGIGTAQLANGSVTAAKIPTGSIMTTHLANGTVTSGVIQDDSITTAKLANGSVSSAKLAAGAVGTTQLADGSITAGKLSANAVTDFLRNNNVAAVPPSGLIFSRDAASSSLINAGYRQVGSINPRGNSVGVKSLANLGLNGRTGAGTVWTGNEFIWFGGHGDSTILFFFASAGYQNDGHRFDPKGTTTVPLPTTGAPAGRSFHSMNWAANRVVVWGGFGDGATNFADGATYVPGAVSWTPLPTSGAPSGRHLHSATWTGREIVIFGGSTGNSVRSDGAELFYNGTSWQWLPLNPTNAPAGRYGHGAVWTGSRVLIWGGVDGSGNSRSDGSLYDPDNNSSPWTAMSTVNAPTGRSFAAHDWTGTELIVWGGFDDTSGTALGTGARYNPATDTWTTMSTTGAPPALKNAIGVWTGDYFIVLGSNGLTTRFAGALYDPETDSWQTLVTHGAFPDEVNWTYIRYAWSGEELLIYDRNLSGAPRHLYRPPFKPFYLYQK